MSDFQPQTTFYLLRNVKLDHSYTNTMDFSNKEEQYNFFFSKKAFEVLEGTYQRKTIGVVRVPFLYDDIATCNYLMWQNANYSDKWYYAFILEIKYINPNLSEIIYDLDVIQTYMFDVEWKPSQIERDMGDQFSDTGIPYVNKEVEDLEYGSDYDTIFEQNIVQLPNVSFMVFGATIKGSEVVGSNIVGMPLGLSYYISPIYTSRESTTPTIDFTFNGTKLSPAHYMMNAFKNDTKLVNSLVSIKVYPFYPTFISMTKNGNIIDLQSGKSGVSTINTDSFGKLTALQLFGGNYINGYEQVILDNKYSALPNYTENKMYMFPYSFGVLTNKRGQDFIVKLEDVTGNSIKLWREGSLSSEPKFGYIIENYNVQGLNFEQTQGIIESIENDLPIIDDYTASYLQSNSNSIKVANSNAKLIQQSALDRANNTYNTGQTVLDNKRNQANVNMATNIMRTAINSTIQGAQTAANFGATSKVMGIAVGLGTMAEGTIGAMQTRYNDLESIRNSALIEANTLKNANISANTDYQVAIASTNAKVQDTACVPPTSKQLGGDIVFNILHGCDGIYFQIKTIKPYYAKKLQDYWKRYGYKENAFRLPWRRKRKYWNYIKCIQANIFGNIPQSDLLKIRDIYMGGITIWHDDDIGNYNRVNEVTDSNI